MSDAMTNREIEDVLTSIRRLVAQDGGREAHNTSDRGQHSGPVDLTSADRLPARPSGRLILTDAQRIDPAPGAIIPGESADTGLPSPDFGRLEATIAELEAAVSASGGTWDAESIDESPQASNVTELYGRLPFAPRREDEVEFAALRGTESEAEPWLETRIEHEGMSLSESAEAEAARSERDDPNGDFAVRNAADLATGRDTDAQASDEVFRLAPTAAAAAEAEAESSETILDEAALHALVAQIVREQLHGQLGDRITAQVRKLVRAEIAKALDERKFL